MVAFPTLITFGLYLAGMLGIGVVAYRATANLSDYVLGGRRLGSGVAALSAGASDMSGWLMLGLPGAIYAGGFGQVWIAVGLLVGAYLNWRLVARRLRIYTELASDALTVPDYFENRFADATRALRVVAASVILLFFLFYTASGMVAGAKLLQASFGLDYRLALWLGSAVIVSYTFLGGFLAVAWTDFVQGVLMLATLLALPLIAVGLLGGWDDLTRTVAAARPGFHSLTGGLGAVGLTSLLAWGLGYFGQPHIVVRFMAVRDPADMAKARWIGMSWMVLSLLGSVLVGYVGFAYFLAAPLADPEQVFIVLATVLVDPWLAGVLLAAILAAIMSTIDSQLLVASSALTRDFYKPFLRPHAGDGELVWVGRGAVAGIALVALLIAADPDSQVLGLVAYAWAGFGAAFGPVILLSLFWRGMSGAGALAGMVVGAATVVAWGPLSGGVFELYEILPGFVAGSIAVVAASRRWPPPHAVTQQFDAAARLWGGLRTPGG